MVLAGPTAGPRPGRRLLVGLVAITAFAVTFGRVICCGLASGWLARRMPAGATLIATTAAATTASATVAIAFVWLWAGWRGAAFAGSAGGAPWAAAGSWLRIWFAHGMSILKEDWHLMTPVAGNDHMARALQEAEAAAARGEVPVGAILVGPDGRILAAAGNRTREFSDPTAHAEMLVIRAGAAALGSERLNGCDLYVTLEPCPMCAAAISFARIRRLYFGAQDAKSGGVLNGPRIYNQSSCHHVPEVYDGLGEQEAAGLLKRFFQDRRE